MKLKILIPIIAVCLALCFVGCSSKASYDSTTTNQKISSYYESPAAAPAEPAALPMPAGESYYEDSNFEYSSDGGFVDNISAAAVEQQVRKIIHNYELNMTTDDFDSVVANIDDKIAELNGYILNKSISGKKPEAYGDRGRSADMTIRIPAEKAEGFLEGISANADVSYVRDYTDDITNAYYDADTRLKMMNTQFDRLNELMAKAETVEDIITIEARMSEVTYEIENLTGTLRRYDELVDYATINVYIGEQNAISGPAVANKTTSERISEGFEENINGVGVFFIDFFVWFVSSLPTLVILAVVAVIVVLIIKKGSKRRAAKKAAKLAAAQAADNKVQGESVK